MALRVPSQLAPKGWKKKRKDKGSAPTHMQHKYAEPCFRPTSHTSPRSFNILLQFSNRIFQRRSRIVHLIDNQYVLSHQVRHLERGEVEPLCTSYLCTGGFNGLGRMRG